MEVGDVAAMLGCIFSNELKMKAGKRREMRERKRCRKEKNKSKRGREGRDTDGNG